MAKKIALVVDDDQFMDNLVNQTLMMNGYNTVVCSKFKHALKSYNKFRIHLVVTDIFMPRMGGIEGIRRLKSGDHGKPYYRNVEGMARHVHGGHGRVGAENRHRRPLAKTIRSQRLETVSRIIGVGIRVYSF